MAILTLSFLSVSWSLSLMHIIHFVIQSKFLTMHSGHSSINSIRLRVPHPSSGSWSLLVFSLLYIGLYFILSAPIPILIPVSTYHLTRTLYVSGHVHHVLSALFKVLVLVQHQHRYPFRDMESRSIAISYNITTCCMHPICHAFHHRPRQCS